MIRYIISSCIALASMISVAFSQESPRVLFIGDSLMAAHKLSARAISHATSKVIKIQSTDRSFLGARMIYKLPITGSIGLSIPKQYRSGDWDWVVVNGGGNDLVFGCACNRCDRKMNRLVGKNGSGGEIAKLIKKIRSNGSRVVYIGYLRSPGRGSPIESCKDEGIELERRMTSLASKDEGVFHVSLADLVPHGDRSFHGADMVHPSFKASRAIGLLVADVIRKNH